MSPLILECARAHPDSGELRRLCGLCSDWDGLIQSALRQKVAPLVFHALHRACPDAVPAEALAALQNRYRLDIQRNLLYVNELFRILDLFGSAGIQAIPFKGPAIAWPLYETPGLRFISDLDLLIPQGDVGRAIDLLTSSGYQRYGPNIGLRFFLDSGQLILRRADGGFAVDLHWRLTAAHFNPLEAAEIRARLTPTDIAGRVTPAFCPEDLLAYLCVHGAIHGWEPLIRVCDLDRLIDGRPLDWDAILSNAARRRMTRMVALGLCFAEDLLASNLPPEVSRHIHTDTRVAELAALTRARIQEGREWRSRDQTILTFGLTEGLRGRFRFLWYRLQPTAADWEVLRIPEFMFPVYYLGRPLRLAWEFLNMNGRGGVL
jgi:hypothetical protein